MEPITIGAICIVLFFVLLATGLPVAFAMTITSFLGMWWVVGWEATLEPMSSVYFNFIANYTISVMPAFILMGELAFHTGLLDDVFHVAHKWLGRLSGGLAIATIAANTVFAACSGSSVAACVVIGQSAIPRMREAGYPDSLSTGVTAAAGTLAVLIPPSIVMCVYGLLVDESIGKLLIAGIIPGVLSAALYVGLILIRYRRLPKSPETFTWKEKIASVRHLWIVVALIFAVLGSIYFGVATPTEAGSIGAFAVLILALALGRLNLAVFKKVTVETIKSTGMILFIIAAAAFFSRLLVVSGFADAATKAIVGLQVDRLVIFVLITAIYFILGCFMSATGMMVITLPIFFPLIMSLGYDPIWFGIIVVKYVEVAMLTPPVGMCVYATAGIAPQVPITTIFRGAVQFVIMDIIWIILLYAFPQIVTFLPSLMLGD